MSDSFGALASLLSGVAARHLGWRPDDFWRATPAELVAALDVRSSETAASEPAALDRATLQRMMENENG